MAPAEGVIRFHQDHAPGPPRPPAAIAELRAWRRICHMTGLIGRDPGRYDGYGYGNISRRAGGGTGSVSGSGSESGAGDDSAFIISGSQTGGLSDLDGRHFVTVHAFDVERNAVRSSGPLPPSSESLTHGVLYAADPRVKAVIHVHSPRIWRMGLAEGWPATPPEAVCGTPQLARALENVVHPDGEPRGLIVMAGHEDGVIGYAEDLEVAGGVLIVALARALQVPGLDEKRYSMENAKR